MPIALGAQYPMRVRITAADGTTLVDPTALVITVVQPDGTTAVYSMANTLLTKNAVGDYTAWHATVQAGLHSWSAIATNPATSFGPDVFNVTATSQAISIVSVDEAIAHLRSSKTFSPANRDQLLWLCQVATAAAANDLGRQLAPRTLVETVDGGRAALVLTKTPVISIISITENGLTIDGTGYVQNGGILYRGSQQAVGCWSHGMQNITVTYRAGYLSPPAVIRKVVLNGVQRMWQAAQQVHPGSDDYNADSAVFAAVGTLTPLELAAYNTHRSFGIA